MLRPLKQLDLLNYFPYIALHFVALELGGLRDCIMPAPQVLVLLLYSLLVLAHLLELPLQVSTFVHWRDVLFLLLGFLHLLVLFSDLNGLRLLTLLCPRGT